MSRITFTWDDDGDGGGTIENVHVWLDNDSYMKLLNEGYVEVFNPLAMTSVRIYNGEPKSYVAEVKLVG